MALIVVMVVMMTPGRIVASPPIEGGAVSTESIEENRIVIGKVSSDPARAFPKLEAMANYLAARLGSVGITMGGVIVAKDNPEMISHLKAGRVDLVSETVFSSLLFSEQTGAEVLAREWKKSVSVYHSIIFALQESEIKSVSDLVGKNIAFEDRGSTTSFMLPLAIIRQQGLETVEVSKARAKPPRGKVGYIFTHAERNVFAWVVRGIAQAGAVSDTDWNDLDRAPEALKPRLRIVHRSRPIPRPLLLARQNLSSDVKSRVKEILFEIHNDPEAADVRRAYYKVARFDAIEGEVRKLLNEARDAYKLIQKDIGI